MKDERLVYMANQIAQYFASYPQEEAIQGVAQHLRHFWEARMLGQLSQHISDGGDGLHELVVPAMQRLRPPAATINQ